MILGHQKILEFLNKSLKTNKISHAYLFVGPEHLGKKKVALEFAKALQCEEAWKKTLGSPRLLFSGTGGSSAPAADDRLRSRQAESPSATPSSACLRELPDEKQAGHLPHSRSHISSSFFTCNQCHSCQEIEKNTHPDVLLIKPEIIEKKGAKKEQEISIEKIRDIQHQLALFPYRGPYKIVIIDGAHKMTKEAANALLKTLEEPTKNTVLILISSALQVLLPTVISRCLLIKFLPVPKTVISSQLSPHQNPEGEQVPYGAGKFGAGQAAISNQPSDLSDKLIRLAGGRPGLVIDYLTNPDLVKKQNQILEDLFSLFKKDLNFRFQYAEILSKDIGLAHQILGQWLIFFRDLMLLKVNCQNLTISSPIEPSGWTLSQLKNVLKEIIKTDQILNNSSFNSRLALEVLMLYV